MYRLAAREKEEDEEGEKGGDVKTQDQFATLMRAPGSLLEECEL